MYQNYSELTPVRLSQRVGLDSLAFWGVLGCFVQFFGQDLRQNDSREVLPDSVTA